MGIKYKGVSAIIRDPKGSQYTLNVRLAESRGLSKQDFLDLVAAHQQKVGIFQQMRDTEDPEHLHVLAEQLTEVEFKIQDAWGFPRDKSKHRWFQAPRCQCPLYDNVDRLGTDEMVINGHCPVHGSLE